MAVVQYCRQLLNLAIEKLRGCILTQKKKKKSQNATQNIVKPHLQCQAMQNTYKLRLHDNMELVRWIYAGKNTTVDENLNRSGMKL